MKRSDDMRWQNPVRLVDVMAFNAGLATSSERAQGSGSDLNAVRKYGVDENMSSTA